MHANYFRLYFECLENLCLILRTPDVVVNDTGGVRRSTCISCVLICSGAVNPFS